MTRLRCVLVPVVLAVVLVMTGCSASAGDIRPLAGDALAAARTVQLGTHQDRAGRILPTTYRVVADDMAAELGDIIVQLEQTSTADDDAERLRSATLRAARDALDAIHLLSQEDGSRGLRELTAATSRLSDAAEHK